MNTIELIKYLADQHPQATGFLIVAISFGLWGLLGNIGSKK